MTVSSSGRQKMDLKLGDQPYSIQSLIGLLVQTDITATMCTGS